MIPRVFVNQLIKGTGQFITLNRDTSKHLRKVLRLKDGDSIEIFDGKSPFSFKSKLFKQRGIYSFIFKFNLICFLLLI